MNNQITFGSVCSGIEAASVAFEPLGWRASWFAEIEPFPSAVLAHHYPSVPNLGDMAAIARRVLTGEVEAPDVLCGGTPCQAFSVAGLRESLNDARGNLTLKFVELADAIDHVRNRAGEPACTVLWENVPGVLSTKDNAFGCFLAGLAGEDEPLRPPGKRWEDAGAVFGPRRAIAWRTLDAQYFGLAQRRRRVFVVASARSEFDPCAVLFEWEGLRRDTAPRREAGQGASVGVEIGPGGGRFTDLNPTLDTRAKDGPIRNQLAGAVLAFGGNQTSGPRDVASALSAHGGTGRMDFESETFIAHSLRGEGVDASESGTGCGTQIVPVLAFDTTQVTSATNRSNPQPGDACHPLAAGAHAPAIAFSCKDHGADATDELAPTLRAMNHRGSHANAGGQMAAQTVAGVRRLTPEECEALQGFPRGYTAVPHRGKPAADGPRYKALGNSWAVPCVRWIARRMHTQLACHQCGSLLDA